MLYLLIAIVAESFGMFMYVRTKRAVTLLMSMRRKREAPRFEFPEPVVYGAAMMALLMGAYDAYVLVLDLLSLPGVIASHPNLPKDVLFSGGTLALVAVGCYFMIADFLHREKQITAKLTGSADPLGPAA